jgi:nitrite reductase (NO-forming)
MKSVNLAASLAVFAAMAGTLVAQPTVKTVANVVQDPANVPAPITRIKPATVTVDIVAQEVVGELVPAVLNADGTVAAPAVQAWLWTFNGTIPGPMVRCLEGDTVVINIRNATAEEGNLEPHNIDFHAAMGPGGGATVTDVMPGETKTLTFKATRAGSYIYHCAGEGFPWEHVSYGMYGMIVVEPIGGLQRGFKEFYVGQSDWYLKPNLNQTTGIARRAFLGPDVMILDDDKALEEHPDYYTLNGNTSALTGISPLTVNQGDKVRIFFVNGGPNKSSSFHVIGQIFDKVATGDPRKPLVNEETVLTPPGSAAIFEMQTLVPGTFVLVDHALWRVTKGAVGFLNVIATVPPTIDPATGLVTDPGSWPLDLYSPIVTGH